MFRLAHATETTATVWVRHTSNGVLTLAVNGQNFTGTTLDTAVGDGTGIVTATGLAAGQRYPFTLSVAGSEIHSGTLRTMPAAGSSFSLLWAYCWHTYRPAFAIQQALNKYDDLAVFFMGGDNIYSDVDTSTAARAIFGETARNIGAILQANPTDTAAALAGLRTLYRARMKEPATKSAIEQLPTYPLISDHDMQTGDNWDVNHTIAAANAYITWATTQDEAIAVYEKHIEAFWDFYQGTPANTDVNKDARWPADRQFYYDFVVGDVHIICLDASSHRDRVLGVHYGATQIAWAKSRLSASTSKWKLIATGEGITEHSGTPGADSQELIDHCTTNGITGVLSIAGDVHAPFYGEYGFPQVRGGQVSQDNHTNIPNGYLGGAKYKWLGYNSNGVSAIIAPHAVTVLRVTPERLTVDYLDSVGNVFFSKFLTTEGGNVLQKERTRLAL
jgi:phosphodiesterase/alkaline phosphatase D-like protein